MIWRNDEERAKACNAILGAVGIGPCFGKDGMSGLGHPDDPDGNIACMSDGARTMLRFALDVWNGDGSFDLPFALGCLDAYHVAVLARFLAAWAKGNKAMARFIEDPVQMKVSSKGATSSTVRGTVSADDVECPFLLVDADDEVDDGGDGESAVHLRRDRFPMLEDGDGVEVVVRILSVRVRVLSDEAERA